MVAFFVGTIFGSLFSFILYALIYVSSENRGAEERREEKDNEE